MQILDYYRIEFARYYSRFTAILKEVPVHNRVMLLTMRKTAFHKSKRLESLSWESGYPIPTLF